MPRSLLQNGVGFTAVLCRVSSRKNKQLLPKGLKVKISGSSITQPFLDPIAVLESS